MADQLLDQGDVVTIKGQEFQVLTISQNDNPDHPLNYHYELVLKSEADALQDANAEDAKRQEAIENEWAELRDKAKSLGLTEITRNRFPTNQRLVDYITKTEEARKRAEEERQREEQANTTAENQPPSE